MDKDTEERKNRQWRKPLETPRSNAHPFLQDILHLLMSIFQVTQLEEHKARQPITEKSNPITQEIDKADPAQVVQLLKRCDAEIFRQEEKESVTNSYKRLYSEPVIQTMTDVAVRVREVLKDPGDSLIVLSGCGTSGRLAFLLAISFNKLLKSLDKKPHFSYLIAGGDKALLTSQEAPEDNPQLGTEALIKACEGKKKVIFIGISCGLSAPFVAGQLDFCMSNLDIFTPVLLGFNPVALARNNKIEGWHFTFRQVAERMLELQDSQKAFVIDPVVGSEGITGSSRMKAGSATKIILETILLAAHRAVANDRHFFFLSFLSLSLQNKSHVYYIGWQTLGIMGIIDASECVPTFGAESSDVRGFVNSGFQDAPCEKGDLASLGPESAILHEDFEKIILHTVTESDTVLFIFTHTDNLTDVENLAKKVRERTSSLHAIFHETVGQWIPVKVKELFSSIVKITWPGLSSEYSELALQMFQWELSTKWILNAVSTDAHVQKGKVLYNFMVDLKVSNSKLFGRALAILQGFTGYARSKCLEALLQSIYDSEELSEEIQTAEVSKHINAAMPLCMVVPTAIVVLAQDCSVKRARTQLEANPVIREALEASLSASGQKKNN
ncbi:glucokinase regulatory protein [Latimeria chalumnae]|uniref:glucokinase regulatory protein n=1 Tax=Latimeria chalumnae TaxID=7897 RepID=UPI00313F39C9